ncbi:MAG: HEAT repeat domain-containing protein [Tepidisphaeraceae bacterium]
MPTPTPSTDESPVQDPVKLLQNDDPGISQNSRDVAALRLISGKDPSAIATVVDLLTNAPPASRLAVARALGSAAWPDPDFIDPLTTLLRGRDQASVTAAAQALGQYQDNGDVLEQLIGQAKSDRPADIRLPVIRALGAFSQKPAAQALIDLQQHDENDQIEAAAGDGLIEMTGLENLDHDPQRWAQWFDRNKGLSDADFRNAIISGRGEAFEARLAQHKSFQNAADDLLRNDFWRAAASDRAAILLSYLQSPAPEIRALGADLVYLSATANGAPPGTIQQTRLLLSDPSPEVRAAAAAALSADFDSAANLAAQLAREQDDVVLVRLINSLAPFSNLRAIDLMLNLVGSGASRSVRIAAVNGIRQGGDVLNGNPATKSRAIDLLKSALRDTDVPGQPKLREAVAGALAAMRDDSLFDIFRQLVAPSEPLGVRANALIGLGSLPSSSTHAVEIARNLDDDEYQMRLATVEAMGLAPKPMALPFISKLMDRMNQDGNDQVRAEAWNVLKNWAQSPAISESSLAALADGLGHDPSKEVFVREKLRDRLGQDAQNDPDDAKRRSAAQDRASQAQDIGDLLMGPALNRPAQAADQYRSALEYWKANNGAVDVINRLCGNVERSLLAGNRWEDAADFAAGTIKDWGNDPNLKVTSQTVARELVAAAGSLAESNDPNAYGNAMELFDAVNKMDPRLPADYLDQLTLKRAALEARHATSSKPSP